MCVNPQLKIVPEKSTFFFFLPPTVVLLVVVFLMITLFCFCLFVFF